MPLDATFLRDLIDSKWATKNPNYADAGDVRTELKEGMIEAFAEGVIEVLTTVARAQGTDSNGDTHDLPIV